MTNSENNSNIYILKTPEKIRFKPEDKIPPMAPEKKRKKESSNYVKKRFNFN